MIIRILEENDRARFRRLRLDALITDPDHFMMTVEEERAISRMMIEQLIERPTATRFFLGAIDGAGLVGMVGANSAPQRKRRHIAEILSLYVKPDYRGQGLGRRLLDEAVRRAFAAPEIRRVRLQVVSAERRRLLKLRREREIGDDVLHKLMREVDLEEMRLATLGID